MDTLSLAIIGKIAFMVLMAAKNMLFISIEILHSWITNHGCNGHIWCSPSGKWLAPVLAFKDCAKCHFCQFVMKRLFLLAALLTAAPAQAARYDFGQGAAAFACVMLDSGYSQNQVYALIDTLDAQIVRGGSTNWRDEKQMVEGFNYQARNNHRNCPLRIRN